MRLIHGFIFLLAFAQPLFISAQGVKVCVLVSANAEWRIIRQIYPAQDYQLQPYGEFFIKPVKRGLVTDTLVYVHGGWGKISAAGSTQYSIDRWHPHLLVNLGTCGGFEGRVNRGDVILVTQAIVYDIIEQMGDASTAIADYTTKLDTEWLPKPYPLPLRPHLLVSADRDLVASEIESLAKKYNAIAGDWESGAIAWVAAHNRTRLVILRGVSDTVNPRGGEAYGNEALFVQRTKEIMIKLDSALHRWLQKLTDSLKK